jgi:OmpA-OmpF porin, OOP family
MIRDLITDPPIEIYVAGHTDRVGTKSYNLELSRRRALSISDHLIASGLDPAIITVCFLGQSNPQVITSGKLSEPRNRRVELVMKYRKEE